MDLLLGILAALAAAVVTLALGFVVGMRRKAGIVQRPLIWLAKRTFNRGALQAAGRPGTATAIVRHTGRTSGRTFETPVDAVVVDDGFAVALPYGTRSQWLRNVLAAGRATLVFDGATHEVDGPELLPIARVAGAFSAADRRTFRIFAVTEALRLHRVSSSPLPGPAPDRQVAARA